MRRIVLYIAMSLDGYLADSAGGVDWLTGQDPAWDGDGGYSDFIRTVDTVIMGRRTYDQITTQLSPGSWPYEGLSAWVLTHRSAPEPEGEIRFTSLSLDRLAARTDGYSGADIEGVVKDSIEAAFAKGEDAITTDGILEAVSQTHSLKEIMKDSLQKMESLYKQRKFKNASA